MRITQLFQPVITIPKNAKIKNTEITCKSQKLLLECGLVRPTSSGLFTILPLARRALNKLEALIRTCLEDCGAQQISLPALTSAGLWEASGRLQGAPAELLKLDDRHGKKYLLAPTHEESIADLLADVGPLSYKQIPLLLYQISNKYRDEHRPKHGLLRSRSFSMMDAYAAHTSEDCAQSTYSKLGLAYTKLFQSLKLTVYQVEAPAGDMGGSLSHEWQLPCSVGEDVLSLCLSCSHPVPRERDRCACGGAVRTVNCIEVGHTFILGTRYSDTLKANYISSEGKSLPLIMSCYGIGITRLLAACLEVQSTEKALRWPEVIAPYNTLVIGPKEGSKEWCADRASRVTTVCEAAGADVLLDDRHALTIGKRLLMADRMGYPTVIVCGKSTMETPPRYEVYKICDMNNPTLCTIEQIAESYVKQTIEHEQTVIKS